MRTELEERRQVSSRKWNFAATVVAVLSLVQLVWFGTWFVEVCSPPVSGACWIENPVPGHEAALVGAGAVAGVATAGAVIATTRRRPEWAIAALVLAVGAAGLGRSWASPQMPFWDAWATRSQPFLVWVGVIGGILGAGAVAAWARLRSPAWAVSATLAVAGIASVLLGIADAVSHNG